MLVSRLHQPGRVVQADFIEQAGTQRIVAVAGAQQVGVGGKRYDELTGTTVGFGDGDIQVAAVTGGEQVLSTNGPGATETSSSNTPRWRTVTRALVSATPRTTGAKPVSESGSIRSSEDRLAPRRRTLSNSSPGYRFRQAPVGTSRHSNPAAHRWRCFGTPRRYGCGCSCRCGASASPQVEAGVQAEVAGALGAPAGPRGEGIGVVTHERGIHAAIPVLRVDVAAWLARQVYLRNLQVEATFTRIELAAGAGQVAGDVGTVGKGCCLDAIDDNAKPEQRLGLQAQLGGVMARDLGKDRVSRPIHWPLRCTSAR